MKTKLKLQLYVALKQHCLKGGLISSTFVINPFK